MKALALTLLLLSPILLVVGMAGCVAAISSIGNGSREMGYLEAFALLVSAPCFVTGLTLLIVDIRRKRHRKSRKGV